jgi:predicted peptidase
MRRKFQISKAFGLNYLLYVPERVQGSRDEKFPTILFLHGLGESGEDPSAVLRQGLPPYVAQHPDFPFIVIAPQCPWNTWWPELADWLDQLLLHCGATLLVDHQRLYLTGLSMGGYGSWYLGALGRNASPPSSDLRRRNSFPRLSEESPKAEGNSGLGFSRGA